MEKKILFYGMTKEKMCFNHILLNALDLSEAGFEVKIIFEGGSVTLVENFEKENTGPYKKVKEKGLIAGICFACSKALGVLEANEKSGLPLLNDMMGHAGIKKYAEEGYEIISM
ncbi:Hypothetical protein ING2D1G_1035 [Peptoniphilus sp. ING2-D1G]|nr:Hypothetical protein ING2D1G_1035 [Peptoniphilus sp. ING2-D1G]